MADSINEITELNMVKPGIHRKNAFRKLASFTDETERNILSKTLYRIETIRYEYNNGDVQLAFLLLITQVSHL
ncbi:MAG: hypothetical protein LRY51_00150 [Geovibrio sp.]|nr:hypothetical protein [Geovibrio sp.]